MKWLVIRQLVCALVLTAGLSGALAAQDEQGGTITGRVVEEGTQQPIPSAQVTVVGTTRGALTNEQGQYQIANVDPGQRQLRVLRIGYASVAQPVTVVAGQTATVDFTLSVTAATLDEVVTTATGEQQRRRETGNTVSTINVDSINLARVNTFSNLLSGRSAGVTVQSAGGTSGTGARVRIRGSNSVSLSNDPLIILDGVRLSNNSQSTTLDIGGQQPSRFEDINPEDIETIDVIKGPAAAALYGTAAANGVIQITTKRGRAGDTRWNIFAEGGSVVEPTDYPANFATFGDFGDGESIPFCDLDSQGLGLCTPDSTVSHNPLEDVSPFRDGFRQSYGLSVAGGGEAATYYVAGEYEDEEGVYDISNVQRVNLRANVRGQIRDNLDVSVSTGFLDSDLELPQNDNNILGLLSGGILGGAFDCSPATPCNGDTTTRGYILQVPDELAALSTKQDVQRFTGGINSNWQPLSWLSAVGTFGIDFLSRVDAQLIPPNEIFFADLPLGQRTSNPFRIFNYTANGGATATFSLTPSIRSQTSAGMQYTEEAVRGTLAFGRNLLPGSGSLGGTNEGFAVAETTTTVVTIGGYLQQQFALRDERLFVTGAVRGDDNSAFGSDFGLVYYPSVSVSWVVGEEDFFPDWNWLSSLRLRSAFGVSGQRPGFRDAVTFFNPVAVAAEGTDVPGVTLAGTGNLELKPEKSREFELGFDAGLFGDRLGLEFTYYNKTTTDALIEQILAPSLGLTEVAFANLGEVNNRGVEALVNANVLNTDAATWDVTVTASTNRNRLRELGEGIEPIIFGLGGASQRHAENYPLGGYWQRPILSFEDANADGLISRDEVVVGDTSVFLGTPFPKREVSINTSLTLFKVLRISGLLDHRGGHKLYNSTRQFRCASFFICSDAHDPTTPLRDQANFIASADGLTDAGYIEDAGFWKLRELAITLMAPQEWADRIGARGLSLTLAGRNLKTWTDYSGFDPEVNANGQFNFSTADFLTQPPVRYYTARLSLNY